MHFTGVAIDGPFQLYNALRRIQVGYRAGVDFQFFHGIGIPFLHYSAVPLLRRTSRGSELARQLVGAFVYPLVFLVFFRALHRRLAARVLAERRRAMAASFALHMSAVLFALNGMLGLRSTLPTLVPVALYLARDSRSREPRRRGCVLGVALVLEHRTRHWRPFCAYVLVVGGRARPRADDRAPTTRRRRRHVGARRRDLRARALLSVGGSRECGERCATTFSSCRWTSTGTSARRQMCSFRRGRGFPACDRASR